MFLSVAIGLGVGGSCKRFGAVVCEEEAVAASGLGLVLLNLVCCRSCLILARCFAAFPSFPVVVVSTCFWRWSGSASRLALLVFVAMTRSISAPIGHGLGY